MSAYVGIDVHRRRSQIAIVEPDGTVCLPIMASMRVT
jgi:hypothetical protein